MATKYKIWVEVERIDDFDTDDETYSDEECPLGIAYVDSLEEAKTLQQNINVQFGEINQDNL